MLLTVRVSWCLDASRILTRIDSNSCHVLSTPHLSTLLVVTSQGRNLEFLRYAVRHPFCNDLSHEPPIAPCVDTGIKSSEYDARVYPIIVRLTMIMVVGFVPISSLSRSLQLSSSRQGKVTMDAPSHIMWWWRVCTPPRSSSGPVAVRQVSRETCSGYEKTGQRWSNNIPSNTPWQVKLNIPFRAGLTREFRSHLRFNRQQAPNWRECLPWLRQRCPLRPRYNFALWQYLCPVLDESLSWGPVGLRSCTNGFGWIAAVGVELEDYSGLSAER